MMVKCKRRTCISAFLFPPFLSHRQTWHHKHCSDMLFFSAWKPSGCTAKAKAGISTWANMKTCLSICSAYVRFIQAKTGKKTRNWTSYSPKYKNTNKVCVNRDQEVILYYFIITGFSSETFFFLVKEALLFHRLDRAVGDPRLVDKSCWMSLFSSFFLVLKKNI